ncbi:DYW deaminase domain-containing protein [Citrus sinensis]|nr:DYW deaminase domain-containing protein [Citrus sinensis]
MGSDRKSKEKKKKSRKRSSSSDSEDERRSKKHRSDRKEKGKEKKSHKHRSDKGLLRQRLRESWRALQLLHLGLQFTEVIMDLKQECNSNDIGTGNQIQHTKQMSQNQSESLCSEGLSSSDEICAALDKFKKKSRDKHHKGDRRSNCEFQELTNEDYFSKNNEFATWLKEEKKLFFSDLSSDSAREYFSDFVKAWNKQKLDSRYYEGISSGPRSAHSWKFK